MSDPIARAIDIYASRLAIRPRHPHTHSRAQLEPKPLIEPSAAGCRRPGDEDEPRDVGSAHSRAASAPQSRRRSRVALLAAAGACSNCSMILAFKHCYTRRASVSRLGKQLHHRASGICSTEPRYQGSAQSSVPVPSLGTGTEPRYRKGLGTKPVPRLGCSAVHVDLGLVRICTPLASSSPVGVLGKELHFGF